MSLKLRYYQKYAVDNFFKYTAENHGKHPIIVLPTAAGKSLVQAHIVRHILDYSNTRILLLTHQQWLIKQNYNELIDNFNSDLFLDIGIYSAGLKHRETRNRILFAGIQSVYKKAWHLGRFDLILIDECHLLPHEGEGMYRRFLKDSIEINPKIVIGGLSATPYRLKHGLLTEGEGHLFDDICYEATIPELIDPTHYKNEDKKQYLCPPISKNAANKVDLENVHIRKGDFVPEEMQQAFLRDNLVQKAVTEIKAYTAETRKRILIFCAGIEHCENVVQELICQGLSARCVHSKKSNDENEQNLNDFKNGKFQYLANVNSLCLDEQTEILTSNGFVGIDEMTMTHKIAAWKLDGNIEFTLPELIVKRQRKKNEKMIIFGHPNGYSANIRVTSNHRMIIKVGAKSKKNKIVSAIKLLKLSKCIIPAYGYSESEKFFAETPQYKQNYNTHVNVTKFYYKKRGFSEQEAKQKAIIQVNKFRNMRYKHPFELSMDECFFIGFWLGDGTISCNRVAISQSMKYIDNVEILDNLFKKLKLVYSRQIYPPTKKTIHNSIRWTFARGTGGYNQSVSKGYFELEPYLNKKGTQLFYGLSKKQIESLLHGLWLADGTRHHSKIKTKRKEISSSQIELFNILQGVCSMRGISATIREESKPTKKKYLQKYHFTYGARKNWIYTASKNIKIEKEYKKERVWCVTSSTSFLICRRKGKVFITGNTTGFNNPAIDCIVLLRATMSPGLYVQMSGRGFRLFPNKENFLVLDFGRNIERHGCIDKIRIKKKTNGSGHEIETAPMKECPVCHMLIAISVMLCPTCGYKFPQKDKHDKEASELEIISKFKKPETVDVDTVFYSRHSKPGKTNSLRVDYICGLIQYSEWVCIEHEGFAKQKAMSWLAKRTDKDIDSIVEALEYSDLLKRPKQIIVDVNGKYPRITGYIMEDTETWKKRNEEKSVENPFCI